MVAIVTSLIFVSAMFVAIGVIASMIASERDRIVGLLDGSLREIALPSAIAIRTPQSPRRTQRLVSSSAPLRVAA